MILGRKDHETLFGEIIISLLDLHRFERLLFCFHEFIPEAVCYLSGGSAAILNIFKRQNYLLYDGIPNLN